jgi:hypothetical protein
MQSSMQSSSQSHLSPSHLRVCRSSPETLFLHLEGLLLRILSHQGYHILSSKASSVSSISQVEGIGG